MRFLIDAQLPPALARWLETEGHQATHVQDHDLLGATDSEIWAQAQCLGAVIVSKDEDFVYLRTLKPEGPPLVWVRMGNTTRRQLLAWFAELLPKIELALANGEGLIEIVPPGPSDSK